MDARKALDFEVVVDQQGSMEGRQEQEDLRFKVVEVQREARFKQKVDGSETNTGMETKTILRRHQCLDVTIKREALSNDFEFYGREVKISRREVEMFRYKAIVPQSEDRVKMEKTGWHRPETQRSEEQVRGNEMDTRAMNMEIDENAVAASLRVKKDDTREHAPETERTQNKAKSSEVHADKNDVETLENEVDNSVNEVEIRRNADVESLKNEVNHAVGTLWNGMETDTLQTGGNETREYDVETHGDEVPTSLKNVEPPSAELRTVKNEVDVLQGSVHVENDEGDVEIIREVIVIKEDEVIIIDDEDTVIHTQITELIRQISELKEAVKEGQATTSKPQNCLDQDSNKENTAKENSTLNDLQILLKYFSTPREASIAVLALNSFSFHNRQLNIKFSNSAYLRSVPQCRQGKFECRRCGREEQRRSDVAIPSVSTNLLALRELEGPRLVRSRANIRHQSRYQAYPTYRY